MPDDIDKAQDADEVNKQDALERQRFLSAHTPRSIATGECLNPRCAEPFAANDNFRLYCGPSCEAEHSKLRRA